MSDTVYPGWKWQNFVVFNDGPLSLEPISDADIKLIEVKPGSKCESKAWSCNAVWYFVIRRDDIILVNVHTRKGYLCRKKSAKFIEAFLEAPLKAKPRRHWPKQLGLGGDPL